MDKVKRFRQAGPNRRQEMKPADKDEQDSEMIIATTSKQKLFNPASSSGDLELETGFLAASGDDIDDDNDDNNDDENDEVEMHHELFDNGAQERREYYIARFKLLMLSIFLCLVFVMGILTVASDDPNLVLSHVLGFQWDSGAMDYYDEDLYDLGNDNDPVHPSTGYVCMRGQMGRLNNWVISMKGGMVFAQMLGKKFVMPYTQFGKFYKVKPFNRIKHGMVIAENRSHPICPSRIPRTSYLERKCATRPVGCKLEQHPTLPDTLQRMYKDHEIVGVLGETLFWNAKYSSEYGVEESFYANLVPRDRIQKKVDEYVKRTFGDKPFVAVHVRYLENRCSKFMRVNNLNKLMCSLTHPLVMEIMQDQIQRTDLPIFVASDRERPKLDREYQENGARYYDGDCEEFDCAVIDFEIASRSNFFIGVAASTASDTIAKLRLYRRKRFVEPYYHNVLDWYPPVNGVSVTTPENSSPFGRAHP